MTRNCAAKSSKARPGRKKSADAPAPTLTATQMATALGISREMLARLVRDGVIREPLKSGRAHAYPLISIAAYIETLKGAHHEKSESREELELSKLAAERDYREAKARAAELDLSEQRGELHRAEDVSDVLSDMATRFRSQVLAMPARVLSEIEHGDSPAQVVETVKRVSSGILDDLADYEYDPEVYRARWREREKKTTLEDAEELE